MFMGTWVMLNHGFWNHITLSFWEKAGNSNSGAYLCKHWCTIGSVAYIMCLAWCLLIQQHCTIGRAAVLTSRSTIVICIIFELLFSFIAATNIVTTNWNSINIFISQYLYCKLNLPEHRAIVRGSREAMLRLIFAIKQV